MPVPVTVHAPRADITTPDCDAIIDAANNSLLGGGGTDGAIHRTTGPELLEACRTLYGYRISEAKLTLGFCLPARYVIHTARLIWHGGQQDEAALSAAHYRNNPGLAYKHGVRNIAFPCISTDAYDFPPQLATPIAVRATREHGAGPDAITFCCLSVTHLALYRAALASDE